MRNVWQMYVNFLVSDKKAASNCEYNDRHMPQCCIYYNYHTYICQSCNALKLEGVLFTSQAAQ